MALSLIQLTLGVLRTRGEVGPSAGQWYILVARLENTIAPGRRASDFASPDHILSCMCVDQLWIKVKIKSEFMNDALTNLSIF